MRSTVTVTYIPERWRAQDKTLVKNLSFEVFPQKNEKSGTCFHLDGGESLLFTAEPRSPKTIEDWLYLQLWGGRKGPFEDRCTFFAKRPVSANTNTGNIGASNTNCMPVPSNGGDGSGGGVYQSFQRENIAWKIPCVLRGNKPTDFDSIREKIGLRGIETQLHASELLPTNPTSFQPEQKPPSQRHNFGCQGNLTPA